MCRFITEDMGAYDNFVMWADGAKNFKKSMLLGTVAHDMLIAFSWRHLQINFGCPKHFKSQIDGDFGVLSKVKSATALRKMLLDVDDVVEAYTSYFERQVPMHPGMPKRFVTNVVPPEQSSVPISRFSPASCYGISHSFSWSITLNDRRRTTMTSLRGRGCMHETLTGLTLRKHGMTGFRAQAWKTGFPSLCDRTKSELDEDKSKNVLEDEEADGDMEIEEDGIARDTQWFRGWRCSYSKVENNAAKRDRFYTYLQRQLDGLEDTLKRCKTESKRHRKSSEALREAAHCTSKRRSGRSKEESKFFVDVRRTAAQALREDANKDEDKGESSDTSSSDSSTSSGSDSGSRLR